MCAELNPRRPIPDVIAGKYTCRGPMVEHCSEFNYDGTDTCAKCQTFYAIDENGHCNYQHWFALITIILMGMAGGLFGFIWVCDLIMRPINNQHELTEAQNFRTRQNTLKDNRGSCANPSSSLTEYKENYERKEKGFEGFLSKAN